MFGHYKRKREKKRLKREREDLSNQRKRIEDESPQRQQERSNYEKQYVDERASQASQERKKGREEGRSYAEEMLSRQIEGLDPKTKSAMQYEANKQVQRGLQGASRRLLGDQGARGVQGRSGVAYAQQADLQRMANEQQGQSTRDLNKLDAEQRLKKLAAMFNIEQGEAAQSQLDRQLALDQLKYEEERRRNRALEDQANRLFSRV